MRVAERLPQWTAMHSQREQRQYGCTNGDHHGTQTNDTSVDDRFLKWLTQGMAFLDEVEEHNDVTDDDADEAGDSEKCHETEGGVHDPKG